MSRKAKATTEQPKWSESEIERRKQVEGGTTIVANLRTDKALIAWAETEGLYVRIDRRSEWGNPYEIGDDGDRSTVIESYRQYVALKFGLLSRLGELRGKVLGCWCYPEPCHGCVLIELTKESPVEHPQHFACERLHRPRKNGPRGVEEVR
jgi:hypothetical protein